MCTATDRCLLPPEVLKLNSDATVIIERGSDPGLIMRYYLGEVIDCFLSKSRWSMVLTSRVRSMHHFTCQGLASKFGLKFMKKRGLRQIIVESDSSQ